MIYTERSKLGANFRKGFSKFISLLIFAIPAFLIKLHVQDGPRYLDKNSRLKNLRTLNVLAMLYNMPILPPTQVSDD